MVMLSPLPLLPLWVGLLLATTSVSLSLGALRRFSTLSLATLGHVGLPSMVLFRWDPAPTAWSTLSSLWLTLRAALPFCGAAPVWSIQPFLPTSFFTMVMPSHFLALSCGVLV